MTDEERLIKEELKRVGDDMYGLGLAKGIVYGLAFEGIVFAIVYLFSLIF